MCEELKPFQKVLVRNENDCTWVPSLYGYKDDKAAYPYRTTNGMGWVQCIPYEGNEHLLGTTDDSEPTFKWGDHVEVFSIADNTWHKGIFLGIDDDNTAIVVEEDEHIARHWSKYRRADW